MILKISKYYTLFFFSALVFGATLHHEAFSVGTFEHITKRMYNFFIKKLPITEKDFVSIIIKYEDFPIRKLALYNQHRKEEVGSLTFDYINSSKIKLGTLFVNQPYRNKSCGSTLLKEMNTKAHNEGIKEIHLRVQPIGDFTREEKKVRASQLIKYYEKHGFTLLENSTYDMVHYVPKQ